MSGKNNRRNTVPFFYKYMSRSTGRIVLRNCTLRWSTPSTLNDPYDMQFDLHVDIDRKAVTVAALQKIWDAHYGDGPLDLGNKYGAFVAASRGTFPKLSREEFDREYTEAIEEGLTRGERMLPSTQEEVRRQMANSKVLCLSEIANNPVMWTHYSESHQGIVLRFRTPPGVDSPWPVARRMNYIPSMPRLFDEEFLSDMLAGRVSFDVSDLISRMVYTKSAEWAYEREWRIFSGAGRNAGAAYEDIPFHPLELDQVILGCRMPEDDKHSFADLIRRVFPHAEIMVAVRSPREFDIDIAPLT